MSQRIGIYAGTFDPIHQGHLAFAHEALRECGLDRVVFLTEASPRSKGSASDYDKRINLLNGALAVEPLLSVLVMPQERFTIADTLPSLRDRFHTVDLTFLMGSDVICDSLASWPDLKVLLDGCKLAVGMRSRNTEQEVIDELNKIYKEHDITPNFKLIRTSHSELASSQFRQT